MPFSKKEVRQTEVVQRRTSVAKAVKTEKPKKEKKKNLRAVVKMV